ncbi:MAG TPA: patatin-like phospholipase family protein, partial [Longimicrobium sp.]|nr:patatin-like phospholipase family protein [Longimicrobium sp.]
MLPTPRSPRLFRVSATLPTLLLASVSAAAQPSAPTPPPADSQTVPVVLTISGGISLGSYQSGVNWALVNFFRHSYHSREFRDAYGVPAYRLAVATGASAGNVNAVLSTLDWCAAYEPRSRAAEESLLWKVWTGMGIHALFPNNAAARRPPRRGDAQATFGIFRRDSIRTLYSTPIGKRFADTLNTACSVQIGVTLTKVAPDSVALNRQIHPRAQRFAAVFTLRTRELGNGLRQLELNPGRVGRNRAFGKVVLPPSSSIGTVEYSAVVDIVEASSAFPLAFEPVDVGFYQPDEVDTAGACPRDENGDCAPSRSDTFMDGGVFDNNPLGLAISLFQQFPGRSPRPEQYIYINPDRVRSRALLPRTPPTDTSRLAGRGLAAIGGLLGGAVPAARQYELHSLARALDERMRERITVTDRGHLLVSSHLGAFAGFLGLPFREFDFYAGMYDGLYYAAHDLVCSRYLGGDTAELRRCTREQLHALLNDGRLALSEPARAVSTRLYREEFPESKLPPLPLPERRGARLLVAIDSALHAAAADTVCRTGSPVARALCRDGFTTFVQKLGTREVRGLTVNWRGCTGDDGDCFADAEMNDLIRDPERYVARLASRVVDRVDNVERGLGRRGSHRAVTLAGA